MNGRPKARPVLAFIIIHHRQGAQVLVRLENTAGALH
jgi:hypothetical protein